MDDESFGQHKDNPDGIASALQSLVNASST
jgi:hypothetical protein